MKTENERLNFLEDKIELAIGHIKNGFGVSMNAQWALNSLEECLDRISKWRKEEQNANQ